MEFQDDAAEFDPENVEQTVKKNMMAALAEVEAYNPRKVDDWQNTIVDSCLKELRAHNRPFKYVVTCIIMQKNGAAVNTCTSMFWDTGKDGHKHVAWENAHLHCIVTVYGCAIHIDNQNELD
ncbi:unnamed protein product [Heterosigma akashiwo]|mmetsp:Transcript_3265/g.4584  ORF Transcript_3265/g.4584 Transcript_3265/m.4584 type:complete len:122 (-) Transcript_3265:247-612(-)